MEQTMYVGHTQLQNAYPELFIDTFNLLKEISFCHFPRIITCVSIVVYTSVGGGAAPARSRELLGGDKVGEG
jgi:hypothetical protein